MAIGHAVPAVGVAGVLDAAVRAEPSRPALIIESRPVSYGELAAAARRAAASLEAVGAGPGWRIPVVGDAGVLTVAATLGAARVGAAAALMNPRLTASELGALARTAGGATLGAIGDVAAAVAGHPYESKVGEAMGRPPLGEEQLLGAGAPRASTVAELRAPDPEAEALVLFTSGTTGLPKAVPLSNRMLAPRISTFARPVVAGASPEVSIMCVPLAHIGGMLGLLVSLASGATTVVQTRFDAGEWLALVERHRVTRAFVVPTMLHRILAHPDFSTADLSSLGQLAYGAAPAPSDLVARAVAALPDVAFSNVFGQTETLGSITALGPEDHRPDAPAGRIASVGRALPGVELRVVDPEGGEDVAAGEVGELWARGGPAGDDWLRTGDLVRRDADGYLFPVGRLSDTINRGGEKFAPGEIEEALRDHPAVEDVAVAGVVDPEMGSRVGVAIVARAPVSLQEMRHWCEGRLASFKLPELLAVVEEIPYNETGKVARRELAALIVRAGARRVGG